VWFGCGLGVVWGWGVITRPSFFKKIEDFIFI
jgi:hypothetical protein